MSSRDISPPEMGINLVEYSEILESLYGSRV
jgi:hypothetical protein